MTSSAASSCQHAPPSYPSAPRRERWNAPAGFPGKQRPLSRAWNLVVRGATHARFTGAAGYRCRASTRAAYCIAHATRAVSAHRPPSQLAADRRLFWRSARRSICAIWRSNTRRCRSPAKPASRPGCARRSGSTIVLYNHSVFGWVALAAALLNLMRPSIVLVSVALAAAGVRAGAAQRQSRRARGGAAAAQPGASRACSRVKREREQRRRRTTRACQLAKLSLQTM